MANRRPKPEEIVTKLRQVEVLVGQGMKRIDAIREIGVVEQNVRSAILCGESQVLRRGLFELSESGSHGYRSPVGGMCPDVTPGKRQCQFLQSFVKLERYRHGVTRGVVTMLQPVRHIVFKLLDIR